MLSGTLGLTVDGEQHLLGPGDSFVVEPGARHLPRNAGEGELRFVAEMRPAGRFEEFLADITAVNNTEREGLAYLLTAARVINRFPDVSTRRPNRACWTERCSRSSRPQANCSACESRPLPTPPTATANS